MVGGDRHRVTSGGNGRGNELRNDSDVKTARRPPGDEAENVQSVNIPSVAKSDGSIKPRGEV
jgi:hypothetical protein